MTIDERAEEYGADLCAYCRECEGEKPCQHKIDAMHGYKDGFKEGLKQKINITTISDCPIKDDWHDLRKDPNDLPKGNNPVLVIIDYLALGKEYAIRENLKEDSKGIIAWCELPTYDKD